MGIEDRVYLPNWLASLPGEHPPGWDWDRNPEWLEEWAEQARILGSPPSPVVSPSPSPRGSAPRPPKGTRSHPGRSKDSRQDAPGDPKIVVQARRPVPAPRGEARGPEQPEGSQPRPRGTPVATPPQSQTPQGGNPLSDEELREVLAQALTSQAVALAALAARVPQGGGQPSGDAPLPPFRDPHPGAPGPQ